MFKTLSIKENKIFNEFLSFSDCSENKNSEVIASHYVKCVVVSSTNSYCLATNGEQTLKINGFGSVIGERGSAHEIGLKLIRVALDDHLSRGESSLLNCILYSLSLKSAEELIEWSLNAKTTEIAEIAVYCLRKQIEDINILRIVEKSISKFVKNLHLLVNKLWTKEDAFEGSSVSVILTGTLFNSMTFYDIFTRQLTEQINGVNYRASKCNSLATLDNIFSNAIPFESEQKCYIERGKEDEVLPICTKLSITEMRNARSTHLDKMAVVDVIELMLKEENGIHKKILQRKQLLKSLIEVVTNSLKSGGRLFYVGAGTSGRLCVLDASECQQTFNVSPHTIQGIIAGGMQAMHQPLENAEDAIDGGIRVIANKAINRSDVVIGVTASGRTPFVWGSLYEAKKRNAFTCLLTFNPHLEFRLTPDLIININLGPEILTGSTRLKCGTATKNILNMISTISMIQCGKCTGNLMSDLIPINTKLKERALRVVLTVFSHKSVIEEEVKSILEANDYNVKVTIEKLNKSLN